MWTRAARLGVSGIQQRASAHRHHHYHHQHNHHHHRRRLSGALLSNFTRTNTSRSECGLGFVQSQISRQGRLRQPVFSSTTNCATRSAPLTRTFSSRTGQQARPDVVLDGALKIASSTLRSAASAVAVFAAVIAVTSGSSTQVAFASKRARQDRKERVSGRRLARRKGIRRIYHTIESTNDGIVSLAEVIQFFRAANDANTAEDVRKFVDSLSEYVDENGFITLANFERFFTQLLRSLFQTIDTDQSGAIEKCEVGTLLEIVYGTSTDARHATTKAEGDVLLARRKSAVENIYQMLLEEGGQSTEAGPGEPNQPPTVDQEAFVDFMIDLLSTPGQGNSLHLSRVLLCSIRGVST